MRFLSVGFMLIASFGLAQAASDSSNTSSTVHVSQPTSIKNSSQMSTSKSIAKIPATPVQPGSTPQPAVTPATPVITIHGLCETTPTESKPSTASASRRSPKICKTVITRGQFDTLANALQTNMDPAMRSHLAALYANLLLMQREFRSLGLEKDPAVKQALAFAKLRSQAEEAAKRLQQKTEVITDADIQQYYHANASFYETADLVRVYIPREKRQASASDTADADQEFMKKEADTLQARASAGEDFGTLQNDAYVAAGIVGARPPVNMGKLTANDLPPGQRSAVALKAGEVSQVIADNGYYIFKVLSKDMKLLEQVQSQIKSILAQQRFNKFMLQIEQSGHTEFNETYLPQTTGAPSLAASLGLGNRSFGTLGSRNQAFAGRLNRRNMRVTPNITRQPGMAPTLNH